VLVAVVGLAACSDDEQQYGTVERFEVAGDDALLVVPDDEVRGVVVYHHGADERVEQVGLERGADTLVGGLARAGWAVAATDAGGDNWGDDASLAANTALWEEVARRLDDPELVVLLGHSMGGLSSLRCVLEACVPDIDGWIGIYPVVDQRTMVDASVAGELVPEILERFGGRPPSSKVPLEQAEALAALDLPMIVWASPDDTVVPMDTNAVELERRITDAGGSIERREAEGEHLDPSHIDVPALVAFLESL
jgi:pimeloyl-ACP methyl ester carboxylesterase